MKWFRLLPDFSKGPVVRLDRELSDSIRLAAWDASLGVIGERFLAAQAVMNARGLKRLTGQLSFPKNYRDPLPELCNCEEWPNLAISGKGRDFFLDRDDDFYIDLYIENLDLTYHIFRPKRTLVPFPDVESFRRTIAGISVPLVAKVLVPPGIEYFRLPHGFEVAGAIYVSEVIKKELKKRSIRGAVYADLETGREFR